MNDKEFFQAIKTLYEKGSHPDRTPLAYLAQRHFLASKEEKFDAKNIVPGVQISTFQRTGVTVEIGFFYLYETKENREKTARRQAVNLGFGDHFLVDLVEQPPAEKQVPGSAFFLKGDISFSLSPYPACCGLRIFHHFYSYSNKLDDELQVLFNDVMVYILKYVHKKHFSLFSSRLEAVFVSEKRPRAIKGRKEEPVLKEDTEFKYQPFRTFFQQTAVKIQSHVFYNYNSGNTLEKNEAVFDSKMFPR